MSVESARAFVVRLMSDEEFRGKLAKVASAAEIETLVAEYSFSKEELEKVVGEFMGHKLAEGELNRLIGEAFEGMDTGADSVKVIAGWLDQK